MLGGKCYTIIQDLLITYPYLIVHSEEMRNPFLIAYGREMGIEFWMGLFPKEEVEFSQAGEEWIKSSQCSTPRASQMRQRLSKILRVMGFKLENIQYLKFKFNKPRIILHGDIRSS
ncbi:hypothetical protein TIFTF001_016204 [Ficus carica]|uniref:Uncharacterized protein n=1 Tax=Ficus carica TaxID=3494 RepID=A0AA87ZZX4_FICCA|nr:hypothetical protein TIFTF001_016204 [Ficus carica]